MLCVILSLTVGFLASLKISATEADNLWFKYASAELFLRVFDFIGLLVLLIIVVSVIFHIIVSSRIFGPLINMQHTFAYIARGDLSRKVILRRKDFLKPEAGNINSMLASLNTRIAALKANQTDLNAIIGQDADANFHPRLRKLAESNQELLDQWILDVSMETKDENR
jgi:methyl-accepting chemotaxis protein